jgi:hypothetical protein
MKTVSPRYNVIYILIAIHLLRDARVVLLQVVFYCTIQQEGTALHSEWDSRKPVGLKIVSGGELVEVFYPQKAGDTSIWRIQTNLMECLFYICYDGYSVQTETQQ